VRRFAIATALAGAALVLAGESGVALAHANYVSSSPASDARLIKVPTEVRVSFSEAPDARSSRIEVFDTAGTRVDNGDTAASAGQNELRVSLKPLEEDGYTVAWTVLSSVDGHETKGSFAFAIGKAALPEIVDIGESSPPPTPVEIAGRVASYMGIALVLGVGAFGLVVHRAATPDEQRRERQLVFLGAALLIAGSALLVLDQGARMPLRLGTLIGLRAVAGLAAIAAIRLSLPRAVLIGAGVLAAITATAVSHAAAYGNPKDMALDFVHVLAISVWTGGVLALLWIVLRASNVSKAAQAQSLGATVWRFSLLALVSVALVITTGALQSLERLVLVQDLVETPYGVALLAKITLLLLAGALGALNLLVWGPRLRAARDALASRRWLIRGTIGEIAIFGLIIVAAGLLTAFAPPAEQTGAAYDSTQHVEGLRLNLLVPTTSPGRNRYVLRVHSGLAPVVNAEKVAFRFTMIEHDMGENELVATERAPGEYVAQGSPTSMFGTWRIQTIVRLPGRADVSTIFQVPISPPAGEQAAPARAYVIGPYTLVVFLDPSTPVTGAPIVMSVVVVDQTGAPSSGKQVRLSFEGPATVTPADAREESPGRYAVTIPSLEAGSWRMTVALGTDGSALYGFEVAR
jgi:copper transport protein